jgi:heme oxygenase
LPHRLRSETRELHQQAEQAGVMAQLIAGRLARVTYCRLLRNLHAVYDALEAALQLHAAQPFIFGIDHPAQHRRAALEADLVALQGADWARELSMTSAARAYVDRLQMLSSAGSSALVAHVYTRSLGDLHGGQMLKARVARMLALTDGAGTAFYDFGSEAKVQALRQRLRDALARLPLTAAEEDAIVTEACWSFQQHVTLFSELSNP